MYYIIFYYSMIYKHTYSDINDINDDIDDILIRMAIILIYNDYYYFKYIRNVIFINILLI